MFNGLMDNMKHKAICYSKVSSDKNFTALIDRCLPMVQENRPRLCKCSTKHQLSIFSEFMEKKINFQLRCFCGPELNSTGNFSKPILD